MIVFVLIFTDITIFPRNPDPQFKEVMGWKHYLGSSMCKGSGEKYIKCHETNTYSENDIFTKSSHSFKIHHFYIHWYFGLPQSIELDIGMITHKFGKSVELNLNRTLDYHIWIMDPRMQVFSQIPETFPRARIDLLQNKTTTVFLKVNVGAHSIDFILRSHRISNSLYCKK